MRRTLILVLVLAVLLFFGFFYYALDPSTSGAFPQCGFLSLTGYKCAGCGSQRAVHALLHGDVVGAFKYNALLLIAIPWITFCLFLELRRTHYPRLYARLNPELLMLLFLALVIMWWILRNIFDW